MGTAPPDAGPNHCTAGAAGNLQSCGNVLGLNKMMTEPNYKNAKILRASDYGDIKAGCIPLIGQGGAADYNIFDSSSNYFLVSCTGGNTRIKWFNPSTMQIVTTVDPQGYVRTRAGAVFNLGTSQIKGAFTTPGAFFVWSGTQVNRYVIASGMVNASATTVADFSYAIPCWSASSSTCGDWVQGTYNRGANIVPLRNNPAPHHVFQLINTSSCSTGTTYPGFKAAFAPQSQAYQQVVIKDGTCQWADMGAPPSLGGRVAWVAGSATDHADKVFNAALSDNKGQDLAGACFGVDYDSAENKYYHLNTCTGNVYNTACAGGRGYACSGGTLKQTYIGNVYSDNKFASGAQNAIDMHNYWLSQSGQWVDISFNHCALVDTSGNKVLCPYTKPNTYLWFMGGTKMYDTKSWLGTGTTGHDFPGFNVYTYRNQSMFEPANYLGKNISSGQIANYWDMSRGSCTPSPCWAKHKSGKMAATFSWDQHGSQVTNAGSDAVPICMESYGVSRGANGESTWPAQYPWLGELVCFATDGSNNVARQAYLYNTQTSTYFNLNFNIGSYSSDGAWWAFSSDWWCTLGNMTGEKTSVCGLPYQENHAYSAGEYLGPVQMYGGVPGRIYRVTTAGTSGGPVPPAKWCKAAGCTVTSGTAVFTYVGQQSAQPAIFIVKLQ